MELKSLGRILFITSIVVFILNIFLILPGKILLVSYLTPIFGIFSLFLFRKRIIIGPGLSISILVMILRYILSPILLSTSSFSTYFDNQDYDSIITFFLMVIEMIIILIVINRYTSKSYCNNLPSNKDYSYSLTFLFLIISIIWTLSDPLPLSRYNFITTGGEELIKTDLSDSDKGLPRVLDITHKFLLMSVFYIVFKLHSVYNKKIILYIGLIVVISLASFYQDTSRNSMLIPLLTILFLSMKTFPKYKRTVLISILTLIVVSMSLLSVMKFFRTNEVTKGLITNEVSAKYINDYFGGFYEVYLAVQHSDRIKSKIDNKTLLNEFFGTTILLDKYMDTDNRTTKFYLQTAYEHSHIIPTIGQGYCYFGFAFSWIFSLFIFLIIIYFDRLYFLTDRIDLAFIYTFVSVKIGWQHPGNFTIAFTTLNLFIVMFLLVLISFYIGKKFKFKKY